MPKSKKKNNSTPKDYINDIDASDLTVAWEPDKTWHRVHGDGKSSTGGKYHLETMKTSDGKYKVKLVGSSIELVYDSQPSKDQMKKDLEIMA